LPAILGGAQVRFTPLMQKRLTRRAEEMIERSLNYFPELQGKTITVGYTRVHLGSAVMSRKRDSDPGLVIRLRVRNLTYQTIGHELTHLVQGLSLGDRPPPAYERIPTGETQCDVWTLARHPLFCDDAPTYIKMPRQMRELWPSYAMAVRRLCVAAIEKRSSFRPYIRWLESEIATLTRAPRRQKTAPTQLTLPFE
ncbi:MAG: hypothetical protein ACREQV_08720, partial [Candidatus Binatia bacterium]